MKSTIKLAVTGLLALSFVSCTEGKKQSSNKGTTVLNSNAILNDSTSPYEKKAERLALAGEQLTSPTSFMYAALVFEQALSVDSNNKRAQFYQNLLAIPMTARGIMARIKPLAYADSKTKKSYDQAVADLPDSAMRDFLMDGSDLAPIKTEKDAQNFIDEVIKAHDQFREWLKNNKNLELTLNITALQDPYTIQQAVENCVVQSIEQGVYEVQHCEAYMEKKVKVNRGDIEILQQTVAGMQVYLSLMNAYDLTGAFAASKRFENTPTSNKTLFKFLSRYPEFGTLRYNNSLSKVIDMGMDLVSGLRWAHENQDELCPFGEYAEEQNAVNRKGFLFESGLCVSAGNGSSAAFEQVLKVVEYALSNGTAIDIDGKDPQEKIKVIPSKIFTSPVQDLKALRPVFNNCDKVQSVSDDTMNGIFPANQANEFLAKSSQCEPFYY